MRDDRPIHNDRRMSDVEAMMWNVGKDPALSSTFGSLSIFDQPVDFARFHRRCEYVVSRVPRLRQRVAPALGRLAPPEWQDDPDFDLDFHVRRTALPAGSTLRDLYELATRLVQDPFDRTRPLWEFVLIEGLEGGQGAMLQKMHHTITDGEGGIRMSELMVDLERVATDPEPYPIEPSQPDTGNILETTVETIGHGIRRSAGIVQRSAEWAGGALIDPGRVVHAGLDATEMARSAARQLVVTDAARSPLWRARSLNRWFDTLDVDFDAARSAAKALDGSLNDFFVAGATHAAARYHEEEGVELTDLRMAMPVSFRSDSTAGGNAFAPLRVLVPAGPATAAERFAEVRDRLTTTKSEKAIGMIGAMAGVINTLPTSVLVRFAKQQTETIDFTTSNVRAAPFDLYIGGGKILGNYPLGPLSGTAFNLTMMSYNGSLNMGLHVDSGAVEKPERLKALLEDAYAELIAAGE